MSLDNVSDKDGCEAASVKLGRQSIIGHDFQQQNVDGSPSKARHVLLVLFGLNTDRPGVVDPTIPARIPSNTIGANFDLTPITRLANERESRQLNAR